MSAEFYKIWPISQHVHNMSMTFPTKTKETWTYATAHFYSTILSPKKKRQICGYEIHTKSNLSQSCTTSACQPIDNISLVEHYVNPIIHLETGENIFIYEKLVNNTIPKET